MKKKRKFTKIYIILALFISIGFAYLSTNLSINGTSTFNKATWNVYFDNIEVDSGSVELQSGDIAPTISNDKLTVSYQVTCNKPGEYYKFNIDVVNDGSLNAKIDSISIPQIPEGYENNIEFSLKYLDGTTVEEGNVLLAGEKTTFVITTKNRDDISADQLISEALTLPMSVSISYTQIKSSDITTATFKTGWEVSTLMNDLSVKIDESIPHIGYGNNIISFQRSATLSNNTNIISTEDSDVPIYMWYEESEELYLDDSYYYNTGNYNEETGELYYIHYGNIYWYSEAQVVYFNEDSSFFFNHDWYEYGHYLDEDYEMTEEESNDSYNFAYLEDISGIIQIKTSKVHNMANMFDSCCSLSDYSLLNSWDVSNVTDMSNMFVYNTSVKTISHLSNWDVSNVTNMSFMFFDMISLDDLSPLEEWNTENVTNMTNMFAYVSMTNLNGLSNWNVSNVTNMSGMFEYSGLTDATALGNWDVSNVTNMSWMFACRSLTDATALENWDVSNVTDMSYMFKNTPSSLVKPSWYS